MSGGFAYVANGPPPAAPGPRGPPRVAPMPPPPPFAPSALPDPLQPSVPNPFGGDRGGLAPPVMPARPPRQGPKLEYPRLTYASVVVEMGVRLPDIDLITADRVPETPPLRYSFEEEQVFLARSESRRDALRREAVERRERAEERKFKRKPSGASRSPRAGFAASPPPSLAERGPPAAPPPIVDNDADLPLRRMKSLAREVPEEKLRDLLRAYDNDLDRAMTAFYESQENVEDAIRRRQRAGAAAAGLGVAAVGGVGVGVGGGGGGAGALTRIELVLPDGTRMQQDFGAQQTLLDVYMFVQLQASRWDNREFKLVRNVPARKSYGIVEGNLEARLGDEGLAPRGTLVITLG